MLNKSPYAWQQGNITLQLGYVQELSIQLLKEIVVVLQLPQLPQAVQSPPGPTGDHHQVLFPNMVMRAVDLIEAIRQLQLHYGLIYGNGLYGPCLNGLIPFDLGVQLG